MSKSIGKAFGSITGTGKIKYDGSAANDYANYLAKYDTSRTDDTLKNLQQYALNQSQNLNDMGNWNFGVNASEEARRQAQDATYNAYMDRLNPQFERQTADYATMLQNKGIPVGSEAYQRAMSDLQDRQNAATNQAAYESVLAGQNAYTQDLQNNIAAGNFGNNAQSAYLAQILAAMADSPTEYDIQGDIYAARSNKAANEYAAKQQTMANRTALVNSLINGAATIFGGR